MKTDEQAESSRRLEEYRIRHERPPEVHEREDEPFKESKPMGSLASDVLFGKPKTRQIAS